MNGDPLPFTTLLERARDGDGDAYAELWRRYASSVAAYVRARGAREVDEVTSDTFLAAFRLVGSFVGDEDAFKGLLFTVARRRVIDETRRSRRRASVSAAMSVRAVGAAPSAEEVALAQADGTFERLLVGLTPEQRDVLVLRFVGDLPTDQVARIIGRRPGAVKALQHRGLARLRRNLEHHTTDLSDLVGEERP